MIFYIIPIIIVIISFCDYIKDKKIRKLILSLILIGLVIFSTFRNTSIESFYGNDTNEYIKFYNSSYYNNNKDFETGYTALNIVIHKFTENPIYLFFIMSLLTMYFFYKYISYYTENELISILAYICIFYYIRDLSQMRAALAYAIVIYSSIYIIEKNPIKFIFFIIIATTIHFSSIFIIFIYPLSKLKFKRKHLYLILFISLLITKINWMEPSLSLISNFYTNKYIKSFIIYTTYYEPRGIDVKFLLYFIIAIASVYIKDLKNVKSEKYELNLYIFIFGIVIASIFNRSEVISIRLSELYITSLIITISYFKNITTNKYLNLTYHTITCWFLITYNIFFIQSLSQYGILY